MAATEEPEAPQINIDYAEVITVVLDMVRATWPLWALLAVIGVVKLLWAIRQQRRLARSRISDIDRMDGHVFERYLQTLFGRLGYRVEHVGAAGGDFGGDLLIQKNGTRTLVQAKRYSKNVGVPAVQQAVTAKAMYDCTEALVVTNSGYTQQARKLARANGVQLVGRDELVSMILQSQASSPAPPSFEATAAVVAAPAAPTGLGGAASCARCGEAVTVKVRDYCLAHRERFAGLVYCYHHQREFKRKGS